MTASQSIQTKKESLTSSIKPPLSALLLASGLVFSGSATLLAASDPLQEKNNTQQVELPEDFFNARSNVTRVMVKGCTQDGVPLTGQFHIIPNALDFYQLSSEEKYRFSVMAAYNLSSIWDRSLKQVNVGKLLTSYSSDNVRKQSLRTPVDQGEYVKRTFDKILRGGPLKQFQSSIKKSFNVRTMTLATRIDATIQYDPMSQGVKKCDPNHAAGEIMATERDIGDAKQKKVIQYNLLRPTQKI